MSIESLRRTVRCGFPIALLALASWPGAGAAPDDAAGAAPPNAHTRRYGGEWECDQGHRRVDQSCVAIAVPENAYLDSAGDRWKCERGFRETGDSCVPVEIPEEGYLGRSGNDWECNRGYQKRDGSCIAVEVPENGYLEASPARLGLRARLQERTPFVPGLPGANARSPRLLGKRVGLRSGLSAAGRALYRGQEIEEPGRPWAEELSDRSGRGWEIES